MSTQPANPCSDFSALYMYLRDLLSEVKKAPESLPPETIANIENILTLKPHANQKNAQILFKTAAEILTEIISQSKKTGDRQRALTILQDFVLQTLGDPCLAAAQALGNLPLSLPSPSIRSDPPTRSKEVSFEDLISLGPICPQKRKWAGRSLIFSSSGSKQVLVLKFSRNKEDEISLGREVAWMEVLADQRSTLGLRCEIPQPLWYDKTCLFSIKTPSIFKDNQGYKPRAIAYTVDRDYFVYPCQPGGKVPSFESFQEIMARSSFLLGQFTSQGMIHSAPIPLFHNQTQQDRRDDHGLYIWFRKGRLDSWLSSCLYPNFGLSGLRDFEHLSPPRANQRHLFQDIGTHFLSLFLVAGSYFRLKEPEQIGWDKDGTPKDMRHLFDRQFLEDILQDIFQNYYLGFVGRPFSSTMPVRTRFIVDRMIEEMGVDRYMTEVFRILDQQDMTDDQFVSFLETKGFGPKEARSVPKGVQEINLYTGPHLGQFNGRISLPEIIDLTAGATAICIAAKHLDQRGIPAFHPVKN